MRSARQRQLVLAPAPGPGTGHPGARSRPVEQAAATCQAVTGPSTPTGPNRPVTATLAAPNAASKSRHGQPSPFGSGWSTPARATTCNRYDRTASNLVPITRSQPRTVAAGTPRSAPMTRCPAPPARASRAAPITCTAYARRTSTVTGNNTWVARQSEHRARRGRSNPARPRIPRARAHPQRRSTPEQSGHLTCPAANLDSTRS